MKEFEGNSNANKKTTEREKLAPITKNVSVRKESEFSKFKRNFFAEDAKSVKSQVFIDVIIPGIKRLMSDIIRIGSDIMIFGSRGSGDRNRGSNNISYSSLYTGSRHNTSYNQIPQSTYTKNVFSGLNEVVMFDRGDAEEVLISLREQIDRFGSVSVADFYDSIGQSSPFTANKYGWRDLRDAEVIRVRDGYSIQFPKAIPLD